MWLGVHVRMAARGMALTTIRQIAISALMVFMLLRKIVHVFPCRAVNGCSQLSQRFDDVIRERTYSRLVLSRVMYGGRRYHVYWWVDLALQIRENAMMQQNDCTVALAKVLCVG